MLGAADPSCRVGNAAAHKLLRSHSLLGVFNSISALLTDRDQRRAFSTGSQYMPVRVSAQVAALEALP